MDEKDKKPDFLSLLRDMLNDHLGKAEFTAAFAKVVDTIKELRADNKTEFEAIRQTVDLLGKKLAEDNTNDLTAFKAEAKSIVDAALAQALTTVTEKLAQADARISELKDGEQGLQGEQGPAGKDGSPDMAEDIRNKLELLQGEERLDVSAIKGLEDFVKKTVPQQSNGTNFVISRGAVKMYDLSNSLDGVLKTFALPAFWRVISVHTSSFPNILRPDVDYTVDGAAMTITFTSQIDETTTLAAGQSLIIVYGEA